MVLWAGHLDQRARPAPQRHRRGLVDFGGSEYGYNMAVDSQGRIALAGYAWSGGNRVMAAARLTSAGALDTTFDGDGKQTVSFGGTADVANVLAIAPDDKVVLGGYTSTGSQATFAVARLTTSGALDTTFDSDGRQTASFGGADVALAIAVQPDGKVILAGYNRTSPTTSDFEVARFTAGGALDTTFSGDGIQTVEVSGQIRMANA